MTTKRIILVTPYDPHDVSNWSGTVSFLFGALVRDQSGIDIQYIRGPLGVLDLIARGTNRFLRNFGISLDCRFSTVFALITGAYLTARLSFVKSGTLLGIASSNYFGYIRTTKEIIYISDGTFRAINALYPAFKKFQRWLQVQGDKNEQKTVSKARYIIYPSRWAIESAKQDYGVASDKIFEIPFGPNISDDWITRYYAQKSVSGARQTKLLFVSADWKRKNGDEAVEICRALIESGVDAHLMVIGDAPRTKPDFVTYWGFLRKSDPKQLAKLCQAYQDAHFLLLPTIADASPIVFSEAQAFGLPSITYNVGGTSSAILHGETGLLFPVGTRAKEIANEISRHVRNPELYQNISINCRRRYERSANWDSWSKVILKIVKNEDPRSNVAA
jgi:glycosyltransferase involved in cell wall biosynthesis